MLSQLLVIFVSFIWLFCLFDLLFHQADADSHMTNHCQPSTWQAVYSQQWLKRVSILGLTVNLLYIWLCYTVLPLLPQRHHPGQTQLQGILGKHAEPHDPPKEGGRAKASGHILQCRHAEISGKNSSYRTLEMLNYKLLFPVWGEKNNLLKYPLPFL